MLTEKGILQFIRDDMSSDRKRFAREGLKYYEGDHDIRNYKLYYFNADGVLIEDETYFTGVNLNV